MKEINLRGRKYFGLVTMVDDEDYDWLNQGKWYGFPDHGTITVRGWIKLDPDEPAVHCWMARLIMACPKELHIDHIDHNNLNNQKSNLRYVDCAYNQRNQKPQGYTKGVCLHKSREGTNKPWIASIKYPAVNGVEGKRVHIGYFSDVVEAQEAYNQKALELYGSFAGLVNVEELRKAIEDGRFSPTKREKKGFRSRNVSPKG